MLFGNALHCTLISWSLGYFNYSEIYFREESNDNQEYRDLRLRTENRVEKGAFRFGAAGSNPAQFQT